MKLVGWLARCARSFTTITMFFGERLWWSGVVTLLSIAGAWLYLVPQVLLGPGSEHLTVRDRIVAVILVPIILTMLVMVFGKFRRLYAAPIAKPDFLTATIAGQRFYDRTVGGIWFFNIVGIPITVVVVYYVIQAVRSVAPGGV